MTEIPENRVPDAGGIELAPGVRAPASAVRLQYSRSSGPGGQNVNKLSTRAELWVSIDSMSGLTQRARQRLRDMAGRRLTAAGEIHLDAEAHRSQEANRQDVLDKLRQLLIAAMHEPKARRKTKPSRASKERRLEQKRNCSEVKRGRGGGGGEW